MCISLVCSSFNYENARSKKKRERENYIISYSGHKNHKHESGTGFYIRRHIMDNLLDFEPVKERMCKIRAKLKYYNLTLKKKMNWPKENFIVIWRRYVMQFPITKRKQYLGTSNAEVAKDNGKRMVKFGVGRDLAVTGTGYQLKGIHKVTWRSPNKKDVTRYITYWLTEDTA